MSEESEKIILALLTENRTDTKRILEILPTLQTKAECEKSRTDCAEKRAAAPVKRRTDRRWIIAMGITIVFSLLTASLGIVNTVHTQSQDAKAGISTPAPGTGTGGNP